MNQDFALLSQTFEGLTENSEKILLKSSNLKTHTHTLLLHFGFDSGTGRVHSNNLIRTSWPNNPETFLGAAMTVIVI